LPVVVNVYGLIRSTLGVLAAVTFCGAIRGCGACPLADKDRPANASIAVNNDKDARTDIRFTATPSSS